MYPSSAEDRMRFGNGNQTSLLPLLSPFTIVGFAEDSLVSAESKQALLLLSTFAIFAVCGLSHRGRLTHIGFASAKPALPLDIQKTKDMESIENVLSKLSLQAVKELFGFEAPASAIQIQKTDKKFEGDLTLVVFPFVKAARKSPEETGKTIGAYLQEHCADIIGFNTVKGFLNLSISDAYWLKYLDTARREDPHKQPGEGKPIVIEYSSPNTNKPLHLGHIRNNLLGWSVAEILKANGFNVKKVNLVNDRGIHICKSMLAWLRWGDGETPQSSGMKGDHLVGKYYVIFSNHLKEETEKILSENPGMEKEEAERRTPLMQEAQQMLKKWEEGDKEIRDLWEKMNNWVYEGFDATYRRLGIDFDKIYYESNTYLLGKSMVQEGLEKGVLYKREDGSVWADLRDEGLDEKLLLRKDGTSVYMTQDLGTARLRQQEFDAESLIYVVGNEQNYHFDVLKRVLRKLGYPWAEKITHLSYGMVELPEGKMKSREGTVVDADDLMDKMTQTAKETSEEIQKKKEENAAGQAAAANAQANAAILNEAEREDLYFRLGMGALKYFILKVDPVKNMLFNPKESIDFNGNTGPFLQYTHARICSLLRKGGFQEGQLVDFNNDGLRISDKEKSLIQNLASYPAVLKQAGNTYSPALIANYLYDLAKDFNGFYQDTPVLRETDEKLKSFRLALVQYTGLILKKGLYLLGISAPSAM